MHVGKGGGGAWDIPREVTALAHELRDDAVERAALVVQGLPRLADALLAGAQRPEVLGGLGDGVGEQLRGQGRRAGARGPTVARALRPPGPHSGSPKSTPGAKRSVTGALVCVGAGKTRGDLRPLSGETVSPATRPCSPPTAHQILGSPDELPPNRLSGDRFVHPVLVPPPPSPCSASLAA